MAKVLKILGWINLIGAIPGGFLAMVASDGREPGAAIALVLAGFGSGVLCFSIAKVIDLLTRIADQVAPLQVTKSQSGKPSSYDLGADHRMPLEPSGGTADKNLPTDEEIARVRAQVARISGNTN